MLQINYWQVSQRVSQEFSLYGLKPEGISGLQIIFCWESGSGTSRVGGSGTGQSKSNRLLKKVSWIKLQIRNQENWDPLHDCHFPMPLHAVCEIKNYLSPVKPSEIPLENAVCQEHGVRSAAAGPRHGCQPRR